MKTRSYKQYLFQKTVIESIKIPNSYRFTEVERLLDQINENKSYETWEQTAIRLKDMYPEISNYLFRAYRNFIKI
jgi:hypothetical protein